MGNQSSSGMANELAGYGPDVFRRLADNSADGIGMARLDSQIIYANATLRRLLGLTDAGVLAEHSFYDYYLPADAARLRDEIIPQVLATGTWTGELKLVSGTGTIWQTIQNVFLIRDENGAAVAFANVITDLTERARVIESLSVNQAAIDSSINAFAMASLEGKITYVNQAFVDLWRLDSADDALGHSPLEFWEQPQQAQVVMEALQQIGRWQGEMRALRHDGSTAELQLSAHLVRNETGHPICMMSSFVDVSVRKLAERELLRSESLLTSIVQQIPAMVFLKSASDLRFELLNRAGEELLGLEESTLLGKSDHDFFPPEQAEAFVAKDREVLASGLPLDILEEPILARNGETRILHTRKIGIYDAAGEPTHLLGVSLDITDKQRAVAALHEQREFATNLVDAAPVIVVVLDPSGCIQYVNPYFEQVSGYRRAELMGREWFGSCLPARDRDRIRELFLQATHSIPTSGNVNPILTRDGKERDIEWSNQALHDADGNIVSVLAIGQDVTERRQIEERTRISEARLNEAQHIAKVGSWELDLLNNQLIWSDEIFNMFEIEQAQFDASYEAFLNSIHPEDRDKVNQAYSDSLANRLPYEITHRLQMSDGRIKYVRETCQSFFDEDGKPLRSVGTVQDITALHQAEEELRRHREFLEDMVVERTREMKIARDEAERANAAKSEFLSRMSHELRTPLNAILGFGQLLEADPEHPLTDDQADNVHEILHAGDHLLSLVNEVLDLARIESGQLDLKLEPVAIMPMLETIVKQLRLLAAQRGITVALELDANQVVQADRLRLSEVLINLLSNAIKYNHEDGAVRVSCVLAGGGQLRISVHDTGRGIAADAMPRLFKSFERMESAYEGIEGTGIGLALVKKLVEAMHGEIGVESVRGEGSTFWFELPLAGASAETAESEPADDATVVRHDRRTILCIEDNAGNLRLVRKILAPRKDIELLDAMNAEVGLEIAASRQPDLILLDINLPGMNGFEAVRQLKENPATRDIPVVALTANAMVRDIELGRAAGFADYLTKPLDVERFHRVVDTYTCLGRKAAESPLPLGGNQ